MAKARGKGPVISLTHYQARILRAILLTHGLVCVPYTARTCNAIIKRIDAAMDGGAKGG